LSVRLLPLPVDPIPTAMTCSFRSAAITRFIALGAIRSDRRGLIEIDRRRLEQASCECYDVMRRQTDQIIPGNAARPRLYVCVGRRTSRWMIVSSAKLHLRVCKRTDVSGGRPYSILMLHNWGCGEAVLEVLIIERSPTKWEWRVCDRYGTAIMGFESTRPAAKYRGNRALFLLLSTSWRQFPRSGDQVVGRSPR
jgi:hypothetical protein